MIGDCYWTTGITVRHGYSGSGLYGWAAEVKFYDNGDCDDDTDSGTISTQGTLSTRYFVREGTGADTDGLTAAIDTVKADAEALGIRFPSGGAMESYVYYEGDGESEKWPPPAGWREMLTAQAQRLGWRPLYGTADA